MRRLICFAALAAVAAVTTNSLFGQDGDSQTPRLFSVEVAEWVIPGADEKDAAQVSESNDLDRTLAQLREQDKAHLVRRIAMSALNDNQSMVSAWVAPSRS